MNISKKLILPNSNGSRTVFFGEATTKEEFEEAFSLRYKVYLERGYIDSSKYPNQLEKDEYDVSEKSHYFIAVLEDSRRLKMIGFVRLIISDPLPTEIDFKFEEPLELYSIPRNHRAELGRFIIIPPNREKGDYLPRGMVMIFLLAVLSEYGVKNGLFGGYAFIKQSFNKKLRRLRFPIKYINKYTQRYPTDGVLYRYFTQSDDPVIPIFFLTESFYDYTRKIIQKSFIFSMKNDDTFLFRNNIYTKMLKVFKII